MSTRVFTPSKPQYRRRRDREIIRAAVATRRPFLTEYCNVEVWADLKNAPANFVKVLGVTLPNELPADVHLEWLDPQRRFVRVWQNGQMVFDEVRVYAKT